MSVIISSYYVNEEGGKDNLLTLVTFGCFTGCEQLRGGGLNRPPSFKDNEWSDKKNMKQAFFLWVI